MDLVSKASDSGGGHRSHLTEYLATPSLHSVHRKSPTRALSTPSLGGPEEYWPFSPSPRCSLEANFELRKAKAPSEEVRVEGSQPGADPPLSRLCSLPRGLAQSAGGQRGPDCFFGDPIKVRSRIFELNSGSSVPHFYSVSSPALPPATPSLKSYTLSSSSGCSTQSSVSSTSLGGVNPRSPLRDAAQNFRDFVTNYEQGLIECLANVESSQPESPAPCAEGDKQHYCECALPAEPDCGSQLTSPHSSFGPSYTRQSLRLQLERVRVLRDQYETGYKCTEAIERLSRLTRSRDCERERRASERLLESIEQQMEDLIGTFRVRVDEIEGWARICPNDNYEIEFEYAKQRQVLRVRIGKSFERLWERNKQEVEFKGSLNTAVVCRVREVKSRWNVAAILSRRNLTLGVSSLSMQQVLSAVSSSRPILLDANPSGTLKLRISCGWQPSTTQLALIPDDLSPAAAASSATFPRCPTDPFATRSLPKTCSLKHSLYPSARSDSFFGQTGSTPASPARARSGLSKSLARSLLELPSFYYDDNRTASLLRSSRGNSRSSSPSSNSHKSVCGTSSSANRSPSQLSHLSAHSSSESLDHACNSSGKSGELRLLASRLLCQLECALQDYRGQYAQLALMSVAVRQLAAHFGQLLHSEHADGETNLAGQSGESGAAGSSDVDSALAEFDFLNSNNDDDLDEDECEVGHRLSLEDLAHLTESISPKEDFTLHSDLSLQNGPTLQSASLLNNSSRPYKLESSLFECGQEKLVDLCTSMLLVHLYGARNHLSHVGSWILKAKETCALSRLCVDTFAFEQIHKVLVGGGTRHLLGEDPRVLQIWTLLTGKWSKRSADRLLLLTPKQLSRVLAEILSSGECEEDLSENTVRQCADWLVSVILPTSPAKLTIFDLRAFFEFELWHPPQSGESVPCCLSLDCLSQIAINLNRLMSQSKKLTSDTIEKILVEHFNVECLWIPADVTMTAISLLYESHSRDRSSKLTTSEVKKFDRLKEIAKVITAWLIWLLQGARFEIRQHLLEALESNSAYTRRAACYGIMYIFKLMKKQREQSDSLTFSKRADQVQPMAFYGQEMDCLLFISMEDPDERVREEAKKSLNCLGGLGQQRLNQMQRSRLGFAAQSNSSECSLRRMTNRNSKSRLQYSVKLASSLPDLNGFR